MRQTTDGLPGPAKDSSRGNKSDPEAPEAAAPTIPGAEIVAQLELIIASPAFETSERNRRFLRYVVEQTLTGRAERIKAYSIATEVFGRAEDFDPAIDPIIRIEASRLRKALEHYYLTAGLHDPVRIAMPKGSYVPTFERGGAAEPFPGGASELPPAKERSLGWRAVSVRTLSAITGAVVLMVALGAIVAWRPGGDAATAPPAAAAGNHASVLVLPFETDGDDPTKVSFSRGFTRQVVAALIRFNQLAIYTADQPPRVASPSSGEPRVDFIVTGATARSGGRLRASVQLADGRIGQQVWAGNFEIAVTEGGEPFAEADLVGRVVRALAEPDGAILVELRKAIASQANRHTTSFDCVLRLQVYWKAPTSASFEVVAIASRKRSRPTRIMPMPMPASPSFCPTRSAWDWIGR